jgi:hypothetical protein
MNPRELEEYRALRDTIRTRGTARVCLFLLGFSAWAGLSLTGLALALPPVATLTSLAVLAATFEAVFALHVGVERVGRYLQVFHEDRWEQTAMDFGAPLASTGADPLFASLFVVGAFLNAIEVAGADAVRLEIIVVGAMHALFLARVVIARRAAAGQRVADLDRFRALKRS